MRVALALGSLALALGAAATLGANLQWLQQPSPTPFITGQQQQAHAANPGTQAPERPQGTTENPFVIKRLDAEETTERRAQQASERDEKAANERRLVNWTIVLALATVALVFVVAGQLGMFLKQLNLMKTDSAHTRDAAKAALASATAEMLSERAYIKMVHDKPGITWSNTTALFTVRVTNKGRTPCTVTDMVIRGRVEANEIDWPDEPPYQPGKEAVDAILRETPTGYLMPDDYFTQEASIGVLREFDAVEVKKVKKLLVFGHVDYIDVFNARRRRGYARQYIPGMKNNLVLMLAKHKYNYDRERKKGEGNDW